MANRRVLKVEILGDSRGVQRAFGETRSAAARLGDNFRDLGRTAATAFAGIAAGLGVLGKNAVEAASDVSEALSKSQQIFGDAAAAVEAFSLTAADTLGQSQAVALEAAASFGIFGKAAGLSGDDLSTFSVDLAVLASDLASFNNSTPEQAIQAIGAALRGESEPIRAYGVLLNDAALKARAMELGIYDGNGALTMQQKVLAAQAEIFAQTGDAQGDFARTSEGVANQSRIVAAQFQNLKATIGKALLPVTQELLNVLTVRILPGLGQMAEVAVPALQGAFDTLRRKMQPVIDALGEFFVPLIEGVVDFAREHTETVKAFFAGFGGTVFAAALAVAVRTIGRFLARVLIIPTLIGAAVSALVHFYKNNEEFRRRVDRAISFVTDTVFPALVRAAQAVRDWFERNWPTIRDTVTGVISSIVGFVQRHWPTVRDTFITVAQAIITFLRPVFEAISREVGKTIDFVIRNWPKIKTAFTNVVKAVRTQINNFKAVLDQIIPFLEPIIRFVRDTFVAFIVTAFETMRGSVQFILDLLNGDIRGAFNSLVYLVTRPLLLVARFLRNVFDTIKEIVSVAVDRIAEVFDFSRIAEAFKSIFRGLGRFVSDIFNNIIGIIVTAINGVIGFLNGVIRAFNALPGPDIGEIPKIGRPAIGTGEPAFMAAGGIVTGPTLAVIGEAGPEAVIPLDRAGAMGNTYNISVNAGIGTDGTQVGAQIVDAIRRFERSSGAGWRAA